MPIILGIDPGSRKTGFGLIRTEGGRSEYLDCGIIRPPPGAPMPERLKAIHDGVRELIARHNPAEMAIEEVFMARDAKAALKLGQARGAAIVAAASAAGTAGADAAGIAGADATGAATDSGTASLPVFEYAARSVKQAITGTGKADKLQVQRMVQSLLRLPAAPGEDAADALAVALCHAHTRRHLHTRTV